MTTSKSRKPHWLRNTTPQQPTSSTVPAHQSQQALMTQQALALAQQAAFLAQAQQPKMIPNQSITTGILGPAPNMIPTTETALTTAAIVSVEEDCQKAVQLHHNSVKVLLIVSFSLIHLISKGEQDADQLYPPTIMLDEEEKNATLGTPNQLTHAKGPQDYTSSICTYSTNGTYPRAIRYGNPRSNRGTKNHALIQIPFLFIVLGEVALSRYTATRLTERRKRRTSHITLFFLEVTVVAMSYDFKMDSSQNDKDSSRDGSFMLLQAWMYFLSQLWEEVRLLLYVVA
ncbi:hypothetical protein Tco_0944258 [Tanacetum coccineum]